ncbi:MAG TPA: alpha/beta hydrolase [Xanthobacteraceae bacterium]|nr:alpha/beta hydrolase [Xanthobacteraceae bacterium]
MGAIAVAAESGVSQFILANDGLKLHVRSFGTRLAQALPVVCLPGLSRTCADFEALAVALASDAARPRYVIALDYRGRGRSDYDRDPANYNPAIELADVISVLTALELGPAVFVGTSRGGILTMLLAAARPAALAGAVLNDIGPVIEIAGLARIKSYVGNLPAPKSFADGAAILRGLFAGQFPKLTDRDWMEFSRRAFKQESGRLVPTHDVRLAESLASVDLAQPPPPLWEGFDALAGVPVMVVRGANSDILTPATVVAMQARRSDLEVLEVPDQGHAPLLAEPETIDRLSAFIAYCDQFHAQHKTPRAG